MADDVHCPVYVESRCQPKSFRLNSVTGQRRAVGQDPGHEIVVSCFAAAGRRAAPARPNPRLCRAPARSTRQRPSLPTLRDKRRYAASGRRRKRTARPPCRYRPCATYPSSSCHVPTHTSPWHLLGRQRPIRAPASTRLCLLPAGCRTIWRLPDLSRRSLVDDPTARPVLQ